MISLLAQIKYILFFNVIHIDISAIIINIIIILLIFPFFISFSLSLFWFDFYYYIIIIRRMVSLNSLLSNSIHINCFPVSSYPKLLYVLHSSNYWYSFEVFIFHLIDIIYIIYIYKSMSCNFIEWLWCEEE